jgi:predicted metal-dependent enzyme (double-stranded beta helix superfamily)
MRDAIVIFVGIILAMLVGSYLFFNGVPSASPPVGPSIAPGENRAYAVLAEGQDAGSVARRTNFLLKTEEEFVELWTMIYSTGGPARPYVDFSRYEVIGVFDGTHSSGGYRVEVTDVAEKDGARVVSIARHEPGDECAVTEAVTSPFQIIRVEKSPLPITKKEDTITDECR